MIASAIFIIPPFCLILAALTDLFEALIPNRVSIVMMSSFILIAFWEGMAYHLIALHLLVGLLVFIVCFVLFIFNIMGGGDVKLLTATSIWFGWTISLLNFVFYVAILGGVLSIGILLIRMINGYSSLFYAVIPKSFLMKGKIPYGIAISIGGLICYPDSYFFKVVLIGISS
ncbi:prepilin peptidase [Candidatus Liberibacter africanus]|uniref:Peptidase A24A prepilin type IV n=1 Tax=Candidatus Liberibacter africanus PTSAPSY TaxID=1277257 RepID=A0A0G3I2D1_LIBAF|nr:prepilin peptidase [Candidatus Liberibacter africanus]AKK20026.1 peptidase A24A prepilin type IV [Candidatus Liberibacter africanus PTSAPSY]QTP63853.1 prepilin peptidase [Candidatus Liberibacter africanus]